MHRGGGCSLKQKTLNPQRRVAAAVIEHRYRHLRLDGVLPYRCRASIPACHFFAADGSACPNKVSVRRAHPIGRAKLCGARERSCRSTECSPYERTLLQKAALQINGPFEQR